MIYDHRLLWLLTSYLVGWLMRYHLLWLLWLVMAWRIIPRIVYGITRGRGTRITKQLLLGWSSKSTNNGEMLGKLGELRGIKGMQVGLVRNSHSLGKFHITTSLFSLTGMMVRGIIPIWPNYWGLWISCWCTTSWEKKETPIDWPTWSSLMVSWFQVPYLKAHSQGTFGNSTLL